MPAVPELPQVSCPSTERLGSKVCHRYQYQSQEWLCLDLLYATIARRGMRRWLLEERARAQPRTSPRAFQVSERRDDRIDFAEADFDPVIVVVLAGLNNLDRFRQASGLQVAQHEGL